MSCGANLVVEAHIAEGLWRRTGFGASLNEIMWSIATRRFDVPERRIVSGQEQSGSKSKAKGQME